MSLQAQSLFRLSCSVLFTLAGDRHPDPVPHTWWHPLRHTHTQHTHLRLQYNSLAANHPHCLPRETATSCLPQRPPPRALFHHMTHTEPLNALRSPNKALPALTLRDAQLLSLFISPGSQTSQDHLLSWHALPPLLAIHAHARTPFQTQQALPTT